MPPVRVIPPVGQVPGVEVQADLQPVQVPVKTHRYRPLTRGPSRDSRSRKSSHSRLTMSRPPCPSGRDHHPLLDPVPGALVILPDGVETGCACYTNK